MVTLKGLSNVSKHVLFEFTSSKLWVSLGFEVFMEANAMQFLVNMNMTYSWIPKLLRLIDVRELLNPTVHKSHLDN